MFFSASLLALFGSIVHGATVTYNFDITWVTANPDGAFERPVMGINGQWPIPPIVASVGDNLVVNVNNKLGNATTSLHFHGLYQNGTTHMDGPIGVTQCAISPGASFKYEVNVGISILVQLKLRTLNGIRSPNPARTGTIAMKLVSTQTGSAAP